MGQKPKKKMHVVYAVAIDEGYTEILAVAKTDKEGIEFADKYQKDNNTLGWFVYVDSFPLTPSEDT